MAKANELNKYTKDEIIYGISQLAWCNDDYIARIIRAIEQKRDAELFEKQTSISDDFRNALTEYVKWKNEMVAKYGDGKSVSLKDIPLAEIEVGAKLESKCHELKAKSDKIDKQINKSIDDLMRKCKRQDND